MLYESTYYGVAGLGDDSLQHHGIKGQKWGVRRFQYEDGILTPAGRARYDVGPREKSGNSYKKGLTRATLEGGLIGRAVYKHKHKDEADAHTAEKQKAKQEKAKTAGNKSDDYKKGLTRATLEGGLIGRAVYKHKHKDEADNVAGTKSAGQNKKMSKAERKAAAYTKDGKLKVNSSDAAITKRVKKDWNDLNENDFFRKYATTKKMYAKNVEKHGDPYAYRSSKVKKSRAETNADAKLELRKIERDVNISDIRQKHSRQMAEESRAERAKYVSDTASLRKKRRR